MSSATMVLVMFNLNPLCQQVQFQCFSCLSILVVQHCASLLVLVICWPGGPKKADN